MNLLSALFALQVPALQEGVDLAARYSAMAADLSSITSLIILGLVGLVVIVVDAFSNDNPSIPWLAGGALAASLIVELFSLTDPVGTAFFELMRTGGYAAFVNIIITASGLMSVVLSVDYLKRLKHAHGEVYGLILFATVGMIVLASANHLLMVFVGLETMSVCLYILTGLVREDRGSAESALKYFLLGAFSTGFFLYGIALIYGATGTMVLPAMTAALAATGSIYLFWAGVALLLVGFLFKVGAAPFHMWTPDVYQGAPTTLTGFMATASKTAAFSSLILVLHYAVPGVFDSMRTMLSVIAVITMVLGNVLALSQENVKRMLAYSSIAHVGYILVALAAGTQAAFSGALYYLLVYTLMNIGAFGVMAYLEWDGAVGHDQTLDSLAGVGLRRPALGVLMGIFMFSLTGFPPLAGFFGKYAVFAPAIEQGLVWLVLVGVLASAVSAYYYLRVLVVFFFQSADETFETHDGVPMTIGGQVVLVSCAILLVILSFWAVPDLTNLFADVVITAGR